MRSTLVNFVAGQGFLRNGAPHADSIKLFLVMRVLVRALRIIRQERNIQNLVSYAFKTGAAMALGMCRKLLIRSVLATVIATVTLTGCVPKINLGGCLVCGDGPPNVANLEGTLSGLVGSGLTLQNGSGEGTQINGPAANGTGVFANARF